MDELARIAPLRERVSGWRRQNHKIALVPTMGNLHDGHIRLIRQARDAADRVIVSIFVNPLQFGPKEDFAAYPRTPEEDRRLLDTAKADLLFQPGVDEIYPAGHQHSTIVDVPELSGILCGAVRPGHFAGVATVVAKLLNIVHPDLAVFGEKDFQQLLIIRRLVADLCMPIEVRGMATARATDGLALSSRNRYLGAEERQLAPRLFAALEAARREIESGTTQFERIEQTGMQNLVEAGFRPEYFAIRQAHDLQPVQDAQAEIRILAAARLGRARLIDNVKVEPRQANLKAGSTSA
ncbi:MAG TPA: pantoate--beta-alanine ligase [Steroidobacteraceae bacterium]|nr:pantoate--beta-alanine ligase [Steroidobacteraceae bacterium]